MTLQPAFFYPAQVSRLSSGVPDGESATGSPCIRAILGEIENILAFERVAAGQDHQRVRRAKISNLVEQGKPFLGGKRVRIVFRLGFGPAVPAGQIAGLGGFPDDHKRPFI